MTGRHPVRNGMGNTAVDISGFGLADEEVTLAEVLSDNGYNTVHIGKWHMGDIREAWPTMQGFDYAAFPIHQQGQLAKTTTMIATPWMNGCARMPHQWSQELKARVARTCVRCTWSPESAGLKPSITK